MMRLVVFFVALIVVGCKPAVERDGSMLFNVDSLLDAQISRLEQLDATGVKRLMVGDQYDSVLLAPGRETWSAELESFRQLGMINRPAYRDLYTMSSSVLDSAVVKTFHPSGHLPATVDLQLTYKDGALVKLEGIYEVSNSLYQMRRRAELYFTVYDGKPLLKQYKVNGLQKMLVGDSVNYALDGSVVLAKE